MDIVDYKKSVLDEMLDENYKAFWDLKVISACKNEKIEELLFSHHDEDYEIRIPERQIVFDNKVKKNVYRPIKSGDFSNLLLEKHMHSIETSKKLSSIFEKEEVKNLLKKEEDNLKLSELWFENLDSEDALKIFVKAEVFEEVVPKGFPVDNEKINLYCYSVENEFKVIFDIMYNKICKIIDNPKLGIKKELKNGLIEIGS